MKQQVQISGFGEILLFIMAGLVFVLVTLFVAKLIRPHRPNPEKNATYESGEEPLGNAQVRFNIRFYLVALLFLLFEVEIIFLFPWATVFGNEKLITETDGLWGWFSLIEMFIFVGMLSLGLVFAWVKGYLEWPKPITQKNDYQSPIPKKLYDQLNQKYQPKNLNLKS